MRENAMTSRRLFQLIAVLAIAALCFGSTGSAMAGGSCARYITVQWGDTLSGIAAVYGTTIYAIQAANPGLGWWLYAGQMLCIPTGYTPPYYPPQTSGSTS